MGIGGQRVQNCSKTIDEIIKPEVYLDDAYLDGFLEILEANMYCDHHINRRLSYMWHGIARPILANVSSSLSDGKRYRL